MGAAETGFSTASLAFIRIRCMEEFIFTKIHIWFPGVLVISILIARISASNYQLRTTFRNIRVITKLRYYIMAWIFFLLLGIGMALEVMIYVTLINFLTVLVNKTLRKHSYLYTTGRSLVLFFFWAAIYLFASVPLSILAILGRASGSR